MQLPVVFIDTGKVIVGSEVQYEKAPSSTDVSCGRIWICVSEVHLANAIDTTDEGIVIFASNSKWEKQFRGIVFKSPSIIT